MIVDQSTLLGSKFYYQTPDIQMLENKIYFQGDVGYLSLPTRLWHLISRFTVLSLLNTKNHPLYSTLHHIH